MQNVEDNENNRGQKYPLQGVTGNNQVLIYFIYLLQFNGTIKNNKTIRIICKRVEHSIRDRSPSS